MASRPGHELRRGWTEEKEEEEEKKEEGEVSKYETFWKAFGKYIKMGLIEDAANRTRLAKLLRCSSPCISLDLP